MRKKAKSPALLISLIPLLFLIAFLFINYRIFRDDTLEGSNQIILILAAAIASLIAIINKHSWKQILEKMVGNIDKAMPSILILLIIGSLAGTWLISGVVPAMIYYGLKIINPKIFLLTALLVSSVVSLATGSSWSTIATIGVALIGIGKALGFHEGLVAGAIISGAYFGDKMSPLSDTTNLAPAVAGTDLFTHIRYMMFTTTPTYIISIILFTIIGFKHEFDTANMNVENVLQAIDNTFNINIFLFIVPIVLIVIIVKKNPPLPSLLLATLLGALFAVLFQPQIIRQVGGENFSYSKSLYIALTQSMFGGITIPSSNEHISDLLSTSGMAGMLNTVWLILSAMVFGGAMEAGGFLRRITSEVIRYAKTTGSLVASTVFTCIFFNLTTSDQYISIVVPGKMFMKTFRERGYKPELLSRTLEDAGTITSVLIPWNTCGATQARVLGVPTTTYLPYAFFNLINPMMAIFIAYLNYRIRKYSSEEIIEMEKTEQHQD